MGRCKRLLMGARAWLRLPATRCGSQRRYWALLAVILAGAFFRWAALEQMNDMLHYDEAYNGADALSLLHAPRLTPFLPGNYGRESGWCYLLVPFIAVFGTRPFALRLAATMTGILTLAASYRLGKEILGARGAIWIAAVLSILYWHVHLSHLALRAILFPLIGTLAFVCLLRAHRTNFLHQWAMSGLCVGLLAYTYFSAYLWILYALVLLSWWWVREREKRRGVGVTLLVVAVVALPMALYAFSHPEQIFHRSGDVGAFGLDRVWNNVLLWTQAWFYRGDPNAEFNLPGRPILDVYLGVLFLVGTACLPLVVKRRWHSLWIVGWAFFSVLPSLMSNQAPHFLRAAGLILPIAVVAGAGAWAVECLMRRIVRKGVAPIVPLVLLVMAGVGTCRDFHLRWLRHPEVFTFMEQHLVQAIDYVKEHVPDDTPVYFSPLSPDHPVLIFPGTEMKPRQVSAFDSHFCLIVPDVPAAYVSLTMYEPGFQRNLSQWSDVTILVQDQPRFQTSPRYTILRAVPRSAPLVREGQGTIVFGDAIQLRPLLAISSTVQAGSAIPMYLGMRTTRHLNRVYSVFAHLYGDPTPYEGGPMWSQSDSQMCVSYPTTAWKPGEVIVQRFDLPVPADTPPGHYVIAVGVYEAPAGSRLPITAPSPQPWDYFVLQEVTIVGAG